MRALVLQHISVEGPGSLAPLLRMRGWDLETVALYAGDRLPTHPRAYQAIIVMGGPMGVYDEDEYPFLRAEHDFLQRAVAQGVPLLGICLGAQLLAKALGARVYRNPRKEIGWYTVDLTPAGLVDPLFAGVTSPVRVFEWHGDAFDLPAGATHLAWSADCAHQAFRYRDRVYGLLFHLELTPEIIRAWIEAFHDELAEVADQVSAAQIEGEMERSMEPYQRVGARVFTNLVEQVWEPLAGGKTEPVEPAQRN
jgi:GMP synthase (glutamine-hydrolysing)